MTHFGKRQGLRYIDRGDPSFYDFGISSFITDGNWHELDLSNIMPFVLVLLRFHLILYDDAVDSFIEFRRPGKSYVINTFKTRICVAGIQADLCFEQLCDSNGKIEYRATDTTFSSISLSLIGWFI